MKLAGFGLLLSGWIILVSAPAVLTIPGERAAFVVAGLLIECLGLGLALRAQRQRSGASE